MTKNQIIKMKKIHEELLKIATAKNLTQKQRFPTYKEFGEPRGWWDLRGTKELLDAIRTGCHNHGLPDVTILLKRKDTGHPSVINGSYVGPRRHLSLPNKRTYTTKLNA